MIRYTALFTEETMPGTEPLPTVPTLDLTPQDITNLVDELRDYHAIYSPLFQRREQREWALTYLHGLLLDLERKSVEPMAIALHGPHEKHVRALQSFVNAGPWDDARILRQHWQEVNTTLGDDDGVLLLDGSDFPKKGTESVGVQRQYCGQLGKRANCQAGVFLGYASAQGATLLDRRLYLPKSWVDDPAFAERRQQCGIPADVGFQTKNELGLAMIRSVVQAGTLRCRWLAADEAFGRDTSLLDAIADLDLWYVVEVPHDTRIWPTEAASTPISVQAVRDDVRADDWTCHTILEGSKGPIIADIVVQRVQAVRDGARGPDVWLVLRWNPETGELKTYLSNAPADTPLATLVRMCGMRWPIETCFETGKQLLGMGDYELRSWRGWHHHMTLVILAHFFLVRMQGRMKKKRRP
jgi:SRSO17 transposase